MTPLLQDIQDRADLHRLMTAFYSTLLEDEDFSHLFLEVAGIDLESHMEIIVDFWESALFRTGGYSRNTLQKHLDLHQKHALTEDHFRRWLACFDHTVDTMYAGPNADRAKVRALSVANVIRIRIHTSKEALL